AQQGCTNGPLPHQQVSAAWPVSHGRREDRINALPGHDVRDLAPNGGCPLLRPGHHLRTHERAHQLGQSVTLLDAIWVLQQLDFVADSSEHEDQERQRGVRQSGRQRLQLHPLRLELRGGTLSRLAIGLCHRDEWRTRPFQPCHLPWPLAEIPSALLYRVKRCPLPASPTRSGRNEVLVP